MKYVIDPPSNIQKGLERVAQLDSTSEETITAEDVILMAAEIFLRIRSLSADEQQQIATIVKGNQ